MATVTFNISDKLADKLIQLSNDNNISIDELIEESIIEHNNISLVDLNKDDYMLNEFDTTDVNMGYYVYVYLNPCISGQFKYGDYEFDYLPVYVGKGTGGRYITHLDKARNDTLKAFLEFLKERNQKPIIVKIKDNISSRSAYKLESALIYEIGRKELKNGPLFNKSGGITFDSLDDASSNLNIEPTFSLELMKLQTLIETLNTSKTKKEAANKLNISERQLYRKIKNHNIQKQNGKYVMVQKN